MSTNTRAVTMEDVTDPGAIVFGALALAALLVSVPATFSVMAHFHSDDPTGQSQAVASLIVFEIGTVTAKLSTLWVPQWKRRLTVLQVALLAFVVIANIYASARLYSGWEAVGSVFFAALMPIFTAIFLALAAARAEARRDARYSVPLTPAERVLKTLQEAQNKQLELALAAFEQTGQNVLESITISNAPSQDTARAALEEQRRVLKTEQKEKLHAYRLENPSASKQRMADAVGCSVTTVYTLLKELEG